MTIPASSFAVPIGSIITFRTAGGAIRSGIKYRHPTGAAKRVVPVELLDRPPLRNRYIRLRLNTTSDEGHMILAINESPVPNWKHEHITDLTAKRSWARNVCGCLENAR